MSRQISEEPPALAGSIEFLVDEEELIKPIDECWNADAHMFIAELIFNREAIEKLAAAGSASARSGSSRRTGRSSRATRCRACPAAG